MFEPHVSVCTNVCICARIPVCAHACAHGSIQTQGTEALNGS